MNMAKIAGWLGSLTAVMALALSCADASFEGGGDLGKKSKSNGKSTTDSKGPKDPITADEDESDQVLRLRYGSGVKPRVADYLFVMDNSVSMDNEAAGVAASLSKISKETFPESAKIAVMTTMAAVDPTAASLNTHNDIEKYVCIEKEPGFLDFVSADAVKQFSQCGTEKKSAYSKSVCAEKWFSPYDVNSSNQRCFEAALQSPRFPVGCEPGLLALKQILARNSGKSLFRENAAVNIIFVSDEQRGCKLADTKNSNVSAKDMATTLKDAIYANSKIASLKLHGIIPPPNEVDQGNLWYRDVIAHFSGYSTEISASGADYSGLIEKVIQDKVEIKSSDFVLPSDAKGVIRIEIDGVATSEYEFVSGTHTVKVNKLDPSKPVEVAIRYQP